MVVLAALALLVGTVYCLDARRPGVLIREWAERLRAVPSLAAAQQLAKKEPVYVRTFSSGEWDVATCEHSCCSGAGFDAKVIRDSTGAIYADKTHTFCGAEGMAEDLSYIQADSLAEFYAHVWQMKLQRL